MNILIKETDTFKIEHDLDSDSILHTVKRFLITEEWMDLLLTGQQYFVDNDLSKWISNNRDLPIIHHNIDDWLFHEWLPDMVQEGWEKWALVEPQISEGRKNQQKYQESFQKVGIEVRAFDQLDLAREWIKN